MNEEERLSALETALNNEMKERAFYLRHAARTKNPVGKAMFQQIGDEELEHYERLKELHAKWEKQEKWPETIPLQVKDTVVKNLLMDSVKGVDVKSGGDDDDLEERKVEGLPEELILDVMVFSRSGLLQVLGRAGERHLSLQLDPARAQPQGTGDRGGGRAGTA